VEDSAVAPGYVTRQGRGSVRTAFGDRLCFGRARLIAARERRSGHG
jgi:hypothetical protein